MRVADVAPAADEIEEQRERGCLERVDRVVADVDQHRFQPASGRQRAPERRGTGRRPSRRIEHDGAERTGRVLAGRDRRGGLVAEHLAVVGVARPGAPSPLDRRDHRRPPAALVEPRERRAVDAGEIGERGRDRVDRGRMRLEPAQQREVCGGVAHRRTRELALEQRWARREAEAREAALCHRERELVSEQHSHVGEAGALAAAAAVAAAVVAECERAAQLQPGDRGRHHHAHRRERVAGLRGGDEAPHGLLRGRPGRGDDDLGHDRNGTEGL